MELIAYSFAEIGNRFSLFLKHSVTIGDFTVKNV